MPESILLDQLFFPAPPSVSTYEGSNVSTVSSQFDVEPVSQSILLDELEISQAPNISTHQGGNITVIASQFDVEPVPQSIVFDQLFVPQSTSVINSTTFARTSNAEITISQTPAVTSVQIWYSS